MLAKAGEGTVHGVVERPDLAAKIFHRDLRDLPGKLDKVAAMVESPPSGAVQPNGFVVLTWPTDLVLDGDRPVGFVMPRVDTATSVEIHTMSNPSNRENPLPTAPQWTRHATWGHLVNTAANLCLAVQVVHRVDAVIGDFQERNILVSDTTQVTLVDCDSMQFIDRTGRRFLCGVGRPEFTAPELAGLDLRTQPRQQPSDLFALAVHIHQLLMAGNHPFLRGTWVGGGEQPDALALARSGDWAAGPGSRLQRHPMAPPLGFLPTDIQQLFVRAFTDGARDPSARPSAQEWREHLLRIRLATCPSGRHQVPATAATCPWCAIEAERQARRLTRAPVRPGSTGPHPVRTTNSQTGPHRVPVRRPPADTGLGANHKVIIAGLVVVVVIVVGLASFIVWALLSGASTFGG
jgi:DNA-binding helix-hairpin-helix protein with protein kinase domain